jgi:hypothetical protein
VDEKYDASELVRVVPVERVTLVSRRGFDDVVAAIYSGLGRPDDFAALVQRWATADGAEAFDAAVAEAAGSAGLIGFLSVGSEFRLHLVHGATWGFLSSSHDDGGHVCLTKRFNSSASQRAATCPHRPQPDSAVTARGLPPTRHRAWRTVERQQVWPRPDDKHPAARPPQPAGTHRSPDRPHRLHATATPTSTATANAATPTHARHTARPSDQPATTTPTAGK